MTRLHEACEDLIARLTATVHTYMGESTIAEMYGLDDEVADVEEAIAEERKRWTGRDNIGAALVLVLLAVLL